MENSPLPEDVMIEIFLLLPFDSILSCKLVSKQWRELINNPKLYNLYRHKSLAFFIDGNKLCCQFIRHYENPDDVLPPFTVHQIPLTLPKNPLVRHQLLLGSISSSIVCVKSANDHFLFHNVFTGESFAVKESPSIGNPNLELGYGFGYDRYTDDYKIVIVHKPPYGAIHNWPYSYGGKRLLDRDNIEARNKNNGLVWVYSFGNRSWEPMVGFFRGKYDWPQTRQRAYSFKGILHWVVTDKSRGKVPVDKLRQVIVTYDLHSSRFGEIELPEGGIAEIDHPEYYPNLTELDGQLCCCITKRSPHDSYVPVWVMKEYGAGVRESWTWSNTIHIYLEMLFPPHVSYQQVGNGRKFAMFICPFLDRVRNDKDTDLKTMIAVHEHRPLSCDETLLKSRRRGALFIAFVGWLAQSGIAEFAGLDFS